jgi:2-oxoglutarate ferredoxin oxidoreductase subunit alpha
MTRTDAEAPSLSIAIVGSGGAGVMTAGQMLLDAAARAGLYGLMSRSSGPQIRGGEAAALLRLAARPVGAYPDRFDALLAVDWQNAHRFADEIPIDGASLVVADPAEPETPAVFARAGARRLALPLKAIAKRIPGGRPNMVALGALAALAGIPEEAVERAIEATLRKDAATLDASRRAAAAGRAFVAEAGAAAALPRLPPSRAGRSAATRRAGSAPCAAASASSPPTRSRRRPRFSNGSPAPCRGSAARWSRPRTNSPRSIWRSARPMAASRR